MTNPLLNVKNLTVEFGPKDNPIRVVDGISFSVDKGAAIGIVGESGSGKSLTSLSILRLVPEPPGRVSGEIEFEATDLLKLPSSQMPEIRGRDIAMIFQEPMSSLNPVMTIGAQVEEALYLHESLDKKARRARAIELLSLVGIPHAEGRMEAYPSQFSGGMRQRVMIAIAVACSPKLLIADEPTTALDVTIQAQVLELMKNIRKTLNTAVLLISHDLGIIADVCDRVVVMYAGKIVENGDIRSIFSNPQHPYTQGLLKSVPSLIGEQHRLFQIPGSIPPPGHVKRGCPFYGRCDQRFDRCAKEVPPLFKHGTEHQAACWATAPGMVA